MFKCVSFSCFYMYQDLINQPMEERDCNRKEIVFVWMFQRIMKAGLAYKRQSITKEQCGLTPNPQFANEFTWLFSFFPSDIFFLSLSSRTEEKSPNNSLRSGISPKIYSSRFAFKPTSDTKPENIPFLLLILFMG